MEQLRILRHEIRRKTLKTRSILAIVESKKFEGLWEESGTGLREEAERLVLKGLKYQLSQWMKDHPSLDLGERPFSYLRRLGKRLRVRNYSRLSKPALINAIKKIELETTIKEQGLS